MKEQFKLAVTPNYGRAVFKIIVLLLSVIAPIILTLIAIKQGLIAPESIRFEIAFPLYLILIVGLTIIVAKSSYKVDYIKLELDSLEFNKIGRIKYKEILSYKKIDVRGFTSYIITLTSGQKIAIGPTSNFSSKADDIFQKFIREFENKVVNTI